MVANPLAQVLALMGQPMQPPPVAANVAATPRQIMLRTRLSRSFKQWGGEAADRPISRKLLQWCMVDTCPDELDIAQVSALEPKQLHQVILEMGLSI